ncbi:MAG: stage II sporulation protein D [Clostridia bacterium]|nr:stage II sporulation protein D [Clostridia bacterium]
MKGYLWLLFLLAVFLLLVPLLALPQETTTPTQQTPQTPTSTTTTTAAPSEPITESAYRILCGDTVTTLPQREFLIRTLAMEMPALYHEEALKAQTVAAYTYYTRRRNQQAEHPDPALKGADFVTPHTSFPQDYTEEKLRARWGDDYDQNYAKICAAVDAVVGQVITYNGALIDACFHAVSNGTTEDAATVWGASVPYLQAVASTGDTTAGGYASERTLTPDEVRTALSAAGLTINLSADPATWFGTPTLSAAGTVTTQPIGDTSLPGTKVRQIFGLRSATFSVTYADGQFTFAVRGYGHGVGMSQYGADYLARQGYTYRQILEHYYVGAKVEQEHK